RVGGLKLARAVGCRAVAYRNAIEAHDPGVGIIGRVARSQRKGQRGRGSQRPYLRWIHARAAYDGNPSLLAWIIPFELDERAGREAISSEVAGLAIVGDRDADGLVHRIACAVRSEGNIVAAGRRGGWDPVGPARASGEDADRSQQEQRQSRAPRP